MKNQMTPSQRTVGELIEILKQYPAATIISGGTDSGDHAVSDICIIQGNCPDGILNNVGIYFIDK